MKKTARRGFLIGLLAVLGAGATISWPICRGFGRNPEKPYDSPNWSNGHFYNLPNSYRYENLANETDYPEGWLKFFLERNSDRYPPKPVEFQKSDLKNLEDGQFVWLGHSSLLVKLDGKVFCFDPVLSSYASPVPFTIPAWPGSTPYAASDFPKIDYLCITHDHWDHLDLATLKALDFENIICGKGVASHFTYWGIKPEPLELDWFGHLRAGNVSVHFTPSMHFSGRSFDRDRTLWGGFILNAGSGGKVYITGDGGFGFHFADIGKRLGPFDIIFPDSGQYNKKWSTVHMFPEQAVQAAADAKSRLACPIHIGKFTLSWHPWNEPMKRFAKRAFETGQDYILPKIGSIRNISSV